MIIYFVSLSSQKLRINYKVYFTISPEYIHDLALKLINFTTAYINYSSMPKNYLRSYSKCQFNMMQANNELNS